MPSTRKMTTKSGKVFYEISVSRGRGKSRLTAGGMRRMAGARRPLSASLPLCRQSLSGSVMQARP